MSLAQEMAQLLTKTAQLADDRARLLELMERWVDRGWPGEGRDDLWDEAKALHRELVEED